MTREAAPLDVVVLMTCWNRRETTLAALSGLRSQRLGPDVEVRVVLVDDASSDGTGGQVERHFPDVTLVQGTGTLFWSGGMALAQATATREHEPDYLLWLNDDVTLDQDALSRLLDQAVGERPTVVVGALRDPATGATTYSGFRRFGHRPTQVRLLTPATWAQPADSFNGNVVLVPRSVYRAVGGVDRDYVQNGGDLDYGYRVSRAGYGTVLAPGFFGYCSRNATTGTWRDRDLPRRRRLALLRSPKGLPVASQMRLMRRHAGPMWPVHLVGSYVRPLCSVLRSRSA